MWVWILSLICEFGYWVLIVSFDLWIRIISKEDISILIDLNNKPKDYILLKFSDKEGKHELTDKETIDELNKLFKNRII